MELALFADGSGAPAVVTVKGWTYAVDFLGELKCTLLTATNRKAPKWVADWVRKTYMAALEAKANPEWFAANKAMYSDA